MRRMSTCNNCALHCLSGITTDSDQGDDVLSWGKEAFERGSGFGSVQGDFRAMPQILRCVAQEKGVSGRGRGTPGHRQRIRRDIWEVELGDRAEPCKSKDAVGQETVNDGDRIQYAPAPQTEKLGCDWSGPASDVGIKGFDVERLWWRDWWTSQGWRYVSKEWECDSMRATPGVLMSKRMRRMETLLRTRERRTSEWAH